MCHFVTIRLLPKPQRHITTAKHSCLIKWWGVPSRALKDCCESETEYTLGKNQDFSNLYSLIWHFSVTLFNPFPLSPECSIPTANPLLIRRVEIFSTMDIGYLKISMSPPECFPAFLHCVGWTFQVALLPQRDLVTVAMGNIMMPIKVGILEDIPRSDPWRGNDNLVSHPCVQNRHW